MRPSQPWEPRCERVIESLDLPLTPDELRGKVSAQAPRDSTLINIRASDADPVVAAAIANAIANELIAASPAIQGQQADVQAFVDRQLERAPVADPADSG